MPERGRKVPFSVVLYIYGYIYRLGEMVADELLLVKLYVNITGYLKEVSADMTVH